MQYVSYGTFELNFKDLALNAELYSIFLQIIFIIIHQCLLLQFASTNYPALFGIVFLVSVALSLAVFLIAVGLWNMDPGKDSIIYRVVTTRMKKD